MATLPYREAGQSIEARAADLLGRMMLDEKLAQLGSWWSFELLTNGVLDRAKVDERIGRGIGHVTRIQGANNIHRRQAAMLANQIQRYLVEETRLGIPAIVHEECLHGLLALDNVCFPQSIGQAATWDPELVRAMTDRLGRELRAVGAHQALAPILDITRDPRWGRVEETYGEDPHLAAVMGAAFIRGLQGDGEPSERVIATAKHMVGHGVPEGGLNHAPAHIGPRELVDAFLFPFEAAVRGAGLRSAMNAYDDVDGLPCVANRHLLTETLRGRWGFNGTVVADYASIDELVTSHAMTADRSEAAAMAIEAGLDIELPTTQFFGAPLAEAVRTGRVSMATIDQAVERVLRAKFELGLFERPYVDPEAVELPFEEDRALARRIAAASLVLLANDGTLPLRADVGTIAVIGPNADSARNLQGDYAHQIHMEALIEMSKLPGAMPLPEDFVATDELAGKGSILDAVRTRVGEGRVRYAAGCGILDGDDAGIAAAVVAARGADVAIVVAGERSGLTHDCTCGESRDRMAIGLPGRQQELIAAVAATGTPVVLVLVSGRPLAIPEAAAESAAVLAAWVPGEEGHEAIAAALFGEANPGGKLPITVPRHTGQIPIYYGHKPSGGQSHWQVQYVDGSNEPLWPFGFGLSYATFEVADLALNRSEAGPEDVVEVSVGVRNAGARAGDEVVQLYARDVEASVTRPHEQLLGFKRVSLAPGESRRVVFALAIEQLAFIGVDGRPVVEPGRIEIMVGTSSADLPCRSEFTITGKPVEIANRRAYFTADRVE